MGAIYILWLRELKRYVRSRVQIVVSLGQPCLYLLALGFGLGPVFRQAMAAICSSWLRAWWG
jgi:ABC-2 type transport system permease protein